MGRLVSGHMLLVFFLYGLPDTALFFSNLTQLYASRGESRSLGRFNCGDGNSGKSPGDQ